MGLSERGFHERLSIGLAQFTSQDDIKKAYRKLAQQLRRRRRNGQGEYLQKPREMLWGTCSTGKAFRGGAWASWRSICRVLLAAILSLSLGADRVSGQQKNPRQTDGCAKCGTLGCGSRIGALFRSKDHFLPMITPRKRGQSQAYPPLSRGERRLRAKGRGTPFRRGHDGDILGDRLTKRGRLERLPRPTGAQHRSDCGWQRCIAAHKHASWRRQDDARRRFAGSAEGGGGTAPQPRRPISPSRARS